MQDMRDIRIVVVSHGQITHNPHHAWAVGGRFTILKRGRSLGYFGKTDITREELDALSHEAAVLSP